MPSSRLLLPLIITACAFCAASRAVAQPSEEDVVRFQRLQLMPITFYPEFDAREGGYLERLGALARPGDAVVVSLVDFKNRRYKSVVPDNLALWYLASSRFSVDSLNDGTPEQGSALVLAPDTRDADRLATLVRDQRATCDRLRWPLMVALDERAYKHPAAVEAVAREAQGITIYAGRLLRKKPREYRALVERAAQAARAANPHIVIEVAVAVGRTQEATQAMAGVLWDCADLADRIAIYLDETEEARTSLEQLVVTLRPRPAQ